MARLHLITAHRSIQRSDEPAVIYCGTDADQALASRDAVVNSGEYAVVDKWTPDQRTSRYPTDAAISAAAARAEAAKKAAEEEAAPASVTAVVEATPVDPPPSSRSARKTKDHA